MLEQTHFVLVSEGRTGSNLVASALESHPNIKMYGEFFNRSDYRVMDHLEKSKDLIKIGEDPIDFLESKFLYDAHAVGFKLMYHQAKSKSWERVWSYVRKSFKILHLKRKNLLDRYLSLKLATKSGRYIAYSEEETDYPDKVYIDPFELERAVEESMRGRREADIIFKHSSTLEIFYEDLDFKEIQRFLGVPIKDVLPTTLKQRTRLQSEMIENYEELKEYFVGKQFEEWFNE